MELKKVRKELQQVESRLMIFEDKIKSPKMQKQTSYQRSVQNTPTSKNTPDATTKRQKINIRNLVDKEKMRRSPSREDTNSLLASIHSVGKTCVKKQSYALIAMSKPAQNSGQPWIQINYKNRKSIGKRLNFTAESEQLGRKILFP